MKIIEDNGDIEVVVDDTELGAGDDALAFGDIDDDEPWEEFDPEADAPELAAPPTSFDGVDLEDTSTYERWLQSALKALVAPALGVDGKVGPRTTAAVKSFQSAAARLRGHGPALAVDGIVGEATIAALEETTSSEAPSVHEGDPPPASCVASDISVAEETKGDAVEYVIRGGDDEVRFSYWTKRHKSYRPYAVNRYRGARKGLVSDAQILGSGYSESELGILKANALKESGGAFGAINTWDNQIVSWGMAQFAGHAGTLATLLAELRDDPRSADAYRRFFVGVGVDVDYGEYPYGDETRKGWHVVVRDGDELLRGDPGWERVRQRPRMIGGFLLAGNDPSVQLGQILFWRRSFIARACRKLLGRDRPRRSGARVVEFLTATRSVAVIVRLYNWMPAYVVRWGDRFLAELAAANPGVDVYDPRQWTQALEDAMIERISAERKAVKRGDYDDYALGLSRARGTFSAGSDGAGDSSD